MMDGNYLGRITEAATVLSSKNTPGLQIKFSVEQQAGIGADGDPAWLPVDPTDAYVTCWLSADAKAISRKKLEALGFNGDFEAPAFDNGEQVELVLNHETYEGKEREKWELANWGGGPERAPTDQVRQLSTWWKASQGQAKPAGKPKMPPAPPQPAMAGGAIPF